MLELYNAINNSDYTNPEDLTITTIEDVVYMGMKNDLSFLIDDVLNLYEHQIFRIGIITVIYRIVKLQQIFLVLENKAK